MNAPRPHHPFRSRARFQALIREEEGTRRDLRLPAHVPPAFTLTTHAPTRHHTAASRMSRTRCRTTRTSRAPRSRAFARGSGPAGSGSAASTSRDPWARTPAPGTCSRWWSGTRRRARGSYRTPRTGTNSCATSSSTIPRPATEASGSPSRTRRRRAWDRYQPTGSSPELSDSW